MTTKEIFEKLKNEFNDDVISIFDDGTVSEPFITVSSKNLIDIMLFLRDEKGLMFDYLSCLSGVDYKENFTVVYNLFSIEIQHRLTVKVELPKDNPVIPSVELVWRSADWHERETYDMYGIIFEGHHNLIRILNPYDWEGYPLRKDYKTPEEYHGIKVPY
jgi:NADH-quinone oxidoreductase subunit C